MKKFHRINKRTGEEIEMFGTVGTIESIAASGKFNSNGNEFYNFTAKLQMPRGTILSLGQVYESSFEFLDGKPKKGDKLAFAISLEELKAGNNKTWSISGKAIDEIDEAMLEDIDMM